MAKLIDGKRISAQIKEELKAKVADLKEKGITGALAVIQVGDDPASSVYVRNKKRACEYIGIDCASESGQKGKGNPCTASGSGTYR